MHNSRIIFTTTSNRINARTRLSSLEYDVACSVATTYEISFLPKLIMVGSCNGLVCLSDYKTFMAICNPSTTEYVEVSFGLVEQVPGRCYRIFDLGFGHDPLTNTYKVVRVDITYSKRTDVSIDVNDCKILVYTLGTKEWRRIETTCRFSTSGGRVYVNGALHWFTMADYCRWDDKHYFYKCIMAFNIGREELYEVPNVHRYHASKTKTTDRTHHLAVLQGCLSKITLYSDKGFTNTDIWLMKDYGVKDSWTKLLSIAFPVEVGCKIKPLVVRQQGGILLEPKIRYGDKKRYLYAYDPITCSVNEYRVGGVVNWINVSTYVESLVSIASFSDGTHTYEETKEEGNTEVGVENE
ncbi:hypothetical protein IFM89_019277 [Coptis chinensis]|uniref:F-box associated beta-propeller type 3 domain-containing protein n=1 Tax=Coptis chinensis TaxID=261450 RepID=A0A835LEW7_9MAGN|nr:hypothetical protein IFM89_019277 [Coptis chinensis]